MTARLKAGAVAMGNLGLGLAHVLNPVWWASHVRNPFSPGTFALGRRASAWYRADFLVQSLTGRPWAAARHRWQEAAYEQAKALPSGGVQAVEEFDWRARSVEEFHAQYISQCRPVVLRGVMQAHTTLDAWRFQALVRRFANDRVRLSCPVNRDYTGTISELDIPGVYMHSAEALLARHPELFAELGLDGLGAQLRGNMLFAGIAQLFMGRKKTGTRWHAAPPQNLFIMLDGRKKWSFIDPAYSPLMSPTHAGGDSVYWLSEAAEQTAAFENTLSLLDADDRDAALRERRSPHARMVEELYAKCPRLEVVLEPGDVLSVPPWWWHEVENLSEASVGLATRWFDPRQLSSPNMNFESMLMLRPAPAYHCSLPAFNERFMTLDCKLVDNPVIERDMPNVEDNVRSEDYDLAASREGVDAYYARQLAAELAKRRVA